MSNYKIFSDRIKRYQGQHVVQAWNDQQVVVYDCMSRLWTYRYVGVFDKDEFISGFTHVFFLAFNLEVVVGFVDIS
jgi:hypothetical protein